MSTDDHKLISAIREANLIVATGKDSKGTPYNDIGKLNQAAWIGERAPALLRIIGAQEARETEFRTVLGWFLAEFGNDRWATGPGCDPVIWANMTARAVALLEES